MQYICDGQVDIFILSTFVYLSAFAVDAIPVRHVRQL